MGRRKQKSKGKSRKPSAPGKRQRVGWPSSKNASNRVNQLSASLNWAGEHGGYRFAQRNGVVVVSHLPPPPILYYGGLLILAAFGLAPIRLITHGPTDNPRTDVFMSVLGLLSVFAFLWVVYKCPPWRTPRICVFDRKRGVVLRNGREVARLDDLSRVALVRETARSASRSSRLMASFRTAEDQPCTGLDDLFSFENEREFTAFREVFIQHLGFRSEKVKVEEREVSASTILYEFKNDDDHLTIARTGWKKAAEYIIPVFLVLGGMQFLRGTGETSFGVWYIDLPIGGVLLGIGVWLVVRLFFGRHATLVFDKRRDRVSRGWKVYCRLRDITLLQVPSKVVRADQHEGAIVGLLVSVLARNDENDENDHKPQYETRYFPRLLLANGTSVPLDESLNADAAGIFVDRVSHFLDLDESAVETSWKRNGATDDAEDS